MLVSASAALLTQTQLEVLGHPQQLHLPRLLLEILHLHLQTLALPSVTHTHTHRIAEDTLKQYVLN